MSRAKVAYPIPPRASPSRSQPFQVPDMSKNPSDPRASSLGCAPATSSGVRSAFQKIIHS
jgi:hypothetical protein